MQIAGQCPSSCAVSKSFLIRDRMTYDFDYPIGLYVVSKSAKYLNRAGISKSEDPAWTIQVQREIDVTRQ